MSRETFLGRICYWRQRDAASGAASPVTALPSERAAMLRPIALSLIALMLALTIQARGPCKPSVGTFSLETTVQVFYTFETCGSDRVLKTVVIWRGVERDPPPTDASPRGNPARNVEAQRTVQAAYPRYRQSGMLISKGSWWIVADSVGNAAVMSLTSRSQLEFAHEFKVPGGKSTLVMVVQQGTEVQATEVQDTEIVDGEVLLPASANSPISRADGELIRAFIRRTKFGSSEG
jgi:hypothetical protein